MVWQYYLYTFQLSSSRIFTAFTQSSLATFLQLILSLPKTDNGFRVTKLSLCINLFSVSKGVNWIGWNLNRSGELMLRSNSEQRNEKEKKTGRLFLKEKSKAKNRLNSYCYFGMNTRCYKYKDKKVRPFKLHFSPMRKGSPCSSIEELTF